MQNDFIEFIEFLKKNKVEFVIIGGVALAFYGFPRYTGDIDIWIRPEPANVEKTFKAIEQFFETNITVSPREFLTGNRMITLGEEPVKIEIHTNLDGVTGQEIWDSKAEGRFGELDVYYIGRETFIKNKKAAGRDQDLVDIKRISGDAKQR